MSTIIKGTIDGNLHRELRVDASSHALKVIPYQHSEIHSESAYVINQRTAVDAFDIASPINFYIITPNTAKRAHMVVGLEANTPCYWEMFEDDGNTDNFDVAGGSVVTPINRFRESTSTSGLTITAGATVTEAADSVRIDGSAVTKGSSGGERHEMVLARNTKYLVRATSYVDNNEGSLGLDWYEHTDKD